MGFFYFRSSLIYLLTLLNGNILRKTTFGIYIKSFPNSLLFFLLAASLFFAVDKYAFALNAAIGFLLFQTLVFKGVLLHTCLNKKLFFYQKANAYAQNPLLVFGVKSIVFCLFDEIGNLLRVFDYQNSFVFCNGEPSCNLF